MMTVHERRRFADHQREGLTHKVTIGGATGFITVNAYPDGTPGEVFVHGFGKLGSAMQGWADAFAIMLSMYLQGGADMSELTSKFERDKRFEPCGATDNPDIPECNSLPDYILRFLVLRFNMGTLT